MNSLVERLKERGAFLHVGAAWGFDPDGYLMEQAAKEIERVEAAYERAHQQCNGALNEAARLQRERDEQKRRAYALERELSALTTFRTSDEWHEDIGDVLWWDNRDGGIFEPPYVGSPLDEDWPGYHTHWTPLPFSRAAALTDHPAAGERGSDPTPEELADPLFQAIWQTIKRWDVDTDGRGYHGATGNEAAAILRAIRNTPATAFDPDFDDPATDADAGDLDCCAKARADERERCARIADIMKLASSTSSSFKAGSNWGALKIAAAIRQGGDT